MSTVVVSYHIISLVADTTDFTSSLKTCWQVATWFPIMSEVTIRRRGWSMFWHATCIIVLLSPFIWLAQTLWSGKTTWTRTSPASISSLPDDIRDFLFYITLPLLCVIVNNNVIGFGRMLSCSDVVAPTVGQLQSWIFHSVSSRQIYNLYISVLKTLWWMHHKHTYTHVYTCVDTSH